MDKIGKKILVIDDEVHIRRVIELKLKTYGYDVVTANNGLEGLQRVESDAPDLVITDINMPKMDGKTFCQESNSLKATRPFLTVIITARISHGDRQWISRMDDTVFVEKPFSPSKLLEVVDGYFGVER